MCGQWVGDANLSLCLTTECLMVKTDLVAGSTNNDRCSCYMGCVTEIGHDPWRYIGVNYWVTGGDVIIRDSCKILS